MTAKAPHLAVVLACTRPRAVLDCLDGLDGQEGSDELEVFVVGDVPDPRPEPRWSFPVTWIPCADRHANVRRNLGIEASSAARVAILDDDTVPQPGWVAAALELDAADLCIRTGPEGPVRTDRTARLLHAVYANPIGEVSSAHHTAAAQPVAWYQIPFSNFVASRRVFDQLGLPATDIPWDMDDFDFCIRGRGSVRFEADPRLEVLHDRYPSSVRQFLKYVARLRIRTGEKVVTHPGVYLRIPAVSAAAGAAWLGPAACLLLPPVALAGALGYAGLMTAQVPTAARAVGLRDAPRYLLVLTAIHGLTLGGMQYGMVRAAGRKLKIRRGGRR